MTLGALFSWSQDRGLDPLFLSQLAAAVPLEPDVTVLMDETAFAALVDYVGGVDLNGTVFAGNDVLGFLSLVQDQPEATLGGAVPADRSTRPASPRPWARHRIRRPFTAWSLSTRISHSPSASCWRCLPRCCRWIRPRSTSAAVAEAAP